MKYLSLLIAFILSSVCSEGQGVFDNTLQNLNLAGKVKTVKTIIDNSLIEYSIDSFDSNGYKLKSEHFSREDLYNNDITPVEQHPFILHYWELWFYDISHHLIKEMSGSYNDTVLRTTQYKYDAMGRVIEIQFFNNNDSANGRIHYHYDEKDSVIIKSSTFYTKDDSGINQVEKTLDTIKQKNKTENLIEERDATLKSFIIFSHPETGDNMNYDIACMNNSDARKRKFNKNYILKKTDYDKEGEIASKITATYDRWFNINSIKSLFLMVEISVGGSITEDLNGRHVHSPPPPKHEYSKFRYKEHTRYLKYDPMHNWILKRKRDNRHSLEVTERVISYY